MKINQIDSVEQTAREWRDEARAAEILTTDFIPVNMWMIRYLGLDATLFLSAAYEEFLFLRSKGKKYTKDSIIFSSKKAQLKTGLGDNRQKKAIKILESHHLISSYIENGIPKKRIINFMFGNFNSFSLDLSQFIIKEIETTKVARKKFNEKMNHIRQAVNNAQYNADKLEWETNHPGHNFEDWLNGLDDLGLRK